MTIMQIQIQGPLSTTWEEGCHTSQRYSSSNDNMINALHDLCTVAVMCSEINSVHLTVTYPPWLQ